MPRPKGSKNKKKSETTINVNLRKRTAKDSPPVSAPEPKKLCVQKSPNKDQGRQQDTAGIQYCWICHLSLQDDEAWYSKPCCSRVYHVKCSEGNKFDANSNICPECQLETVDGTKISKPIPYKQLQTLLLAVLNRRKAEKSKTLKNHEIFHHWPRNAENHENIMDFEILDDKIRRFSYSKPAEFFSDIKWILHNCSIIFGSSSPVTSYAKQLVKSLKADLLDMEVCYECFYCGISNKKDFFLRICTPPHEIIWAKMKNCPSWPAKCLKINNGSNDTKTLYVKFFKTHDIGKDIPISRCHFISKEYPNRRGYPQIVKAAFDEVLEYVRAYEKINGEKSFQFCNAVTAYTPPKVERVQKVNKISRPNVAKSGNVEQSPSPSSSQNSIHVAFSEKQSKNHSDSNTPESASSSSSGIDIITCTTTKVITSTPVVATSSDISSDDLTLGADFSNSSDISFRNVVDTPEHPSSATSSSTSPASAQSHATPGPSTSGSSNQNWQHTLHATLRDVVNRGLPNRVSAMMPFSQNGSRSGGVGRDEISSTLISYILMMWNLVKSMPSSSQLLSQTYTELQRHKKLVESLKKESSELKKQCSDLQNAVCKLRCEVTESTKKNDELQQAFNDSTNNARNVVKNIKHEVEQLCESKLESQKNDYEQKLREKDALIEDLENNLKTIKRDYELLQAEYLKSKNLQEGSPSDSSDDKDTATDEGSVMELSVEENIPSVDDVEILSESITMNFPTGLFYHHFNT